jgi:Cu(I)/Ag(I) efflux system periplasmic protein CusF
MLEIRRASVCAVVALLVAAALSAPGVAGTHQALADGEVTKLDASAGKITIRHGPIRKFDMDGMTMVFRANDPSMLKAVKPGDKIKFDVDKINGQMTVTKIEKRK